LPSTQEIHFRANHDRRKTMITRNLLQRPAAVAVIALSVWAAAFFAQAADTKPNIVIIWGDDIGQSNVSAYTKG
jgi:hypothetical protein